MCRMGSKDLIDEGIDGLRVGNLTQTLPFNNGNRISFVPPHCSEYLFRHGSGGCSVDDAADEGRELGSGLYFCHFKTDAGETWQKKVSFR